MSSAQDELILCLASECKGEPFIREAKRRGYLVYVLTEESNHLEPWPRDSIDELIFMPDLTNKQHVLNAVSYIARGRRLRTIVPLDDYDVEMAAAMREHLRLHGMGDTQARYFRDKLAMRSQAAAHGIRVPAFTGLFNYDDLRQFMLDVPPKWVLKPRSEAGAIGIEVMEEAEQVWRKLDELGDRQSHYLLEAFLPGDIFHVDSIVANGDILFSLAHQYAKPPLSVSHGGGIFSTRTVLRESELAQALGAVNAQVLHSLGLRDGVAHAEFIRGAADGELYFLEIGARVGGAHIAEVIEAASGVNLWAEWARLEIALLRNEAYQLPAVRRDYAGSVICLSQQHEPNLANYNDPEVVWRLNKPFHAGLIVNSADFGRTETLLDQYMARFAHDFLAHGQTQAAARVYSG